MATKGKTYLAHTVGRRKSSVARVYISEGTGKLIVNKKDYKEYFPMETSRFSLLRPLTVAKVEDKYDIRANVVGGGVTGQTGAIRLGIARALIK